MRVHACFEARNSRWGGDVAGRRFSRRRWRRCRRTRPRVRRLDDERAGRRSAPKNYASAEQALRAGLDDLNAGNAASCVDALTYAAEGGQPVARWKLGEMYADGVGVQRDDVKAYHYFNQLVQDYDEDALDPRNRGAVSSAFVAVGVYSLTGIPNSDVRPDPERARELFQYAASTFGDPDAQYNLAHMYLVGAGGLAKDKLVAVRWLSLAAGKGHRPSQALLGHLLFVGDGVPPQRARGLMWLTIANNGAEGPKDEWIRDLYRRDFADAERAGPGDRDGDARRARQGPAASFGDLPHGHPDAADPAAARHPGDGRALPPSRRRVKVAARSRGLLQRPRLVCPPGQGRCKASPPLQKAVRGSVSLRAFIDRQLAGSWAGPALICLALIVALFALAGQTANAPFVYAPPQ